MRPKASRTTYGFSLVEALLAVFLLASVSVAATALMSAFFGGAEGHNARAGLLQNILRFRAELSDDLAHAEHLQEETGDCFLAFTRRTNLSDSTIESVRYCLSGGRVMREAAVRPFPVSATRLRRYPLLHDVETIKLAYFDGKEWRDTLEDGTLLARLTITHKQEQDYRTTHIFRLGGA